MSVKFEDHSKEALSLLKKARENALWAIGATAEGHAKDITPVDTGRLRNSIAHAEDKDSTYIGSNVEYAPYIELGAQGRKAHHMLKRAATEHTEEYREIVKSSLKNAD